MHRIMGIKRRLSVTDFANAMLAFGVGDARSCGYWNFMLGFLTTRYYDPKEKNKFRMGATRFWDKNRAAILLKLSEIRPHQSTEFSGDAETISSEVNTTDASKSDAVCDTNNMPGSPLEYFTIKETGARTPSIATAIDSSPWTGESGSQSDASKVTSYGGGLRRAKVGEGHTFTVDCSCAGSEMLFVGMHGPEYPCDEVYVKHIGNRRYIVMYTARDPGQYMLIVKWGENHIPGSPFSVQIT